ncbi:MAG TPA: biotin carboxyl carrier protein [Candidatus Binatia bacterium]|jgi:oxaloacetate decarboxylase alpha subunit|nr:biotin carboxyl carrier protein [Candidatus Binatia bacterium]
MPSKSEIQIVDTTLRDGQLSLWALGMKTGAMLAIAEQMDRCGFQSMEFFGFAGFIKYVREHKENPFDWIRLGTQKFRNTRLRYHGGLASGFEKVPRSVRKLMIERMVAHGITLTRSSDPWNDYEAAAIENEELRRLGMDVVINIIYSVSPRHTDNYYAQKAREAAAIKPYRICFKDVGGLLTHERTRALIPLIKKNIGEVPLEFHAHCNNGLAPFNYLEAIKLGVDILHTAIPPLANGSSQPSILNVASNARALGYTPVIDLDAIKAVEKHFTFIARREGHPIGAQREYDHAQYLHQVPGGMISNLGHQLRSVGMENRLQDTLEEAGRVRAEFGYPIMVTPLAQFVGSQAAINVITGERYKEVTDQVIQYALGHWGKEAPLVMDPNVRDKILNRPRATEWKGWTPPDLTLEEVRQKFAAPGVSDEELVLRVIAGEAAVKAMLAAGAPKEYLRANQPLVRLIGELAKRRDCKHVYIQKEGLLLRMEKNR